jgi:itaconyl-CoA hydratase
MTPDLGSFPVRHRGNRFDAFDPGRTFDHHWGRTITAGDNALFSAVTHAYNPLYFNAEHARSQGHPDVVVNPMLVLGTVVGLSVEDLSEGGGPFLGITDVRFHRPVYPHDTLSASSVVVEARQSASHPSSGIVTWRTEASNQHGELVLSYQRTNLVAKRR